MVHEPGGIIVVVWRADAYVREVLCVRMWWSFSKLIQPFQRKNILFSFKGHRDLITIVFGSMLHMSLEFVGTNISLY